MYPIRKTTISIACLLAINILNPTGTSALAQSEGASTNDTKMLSQEGASEESIPELRLHIKKLAQELQIKRRNEKDNLGTPKNSGEEIETPPAPEDPQIPETPMTPQAPETPPVPENPPMPETPTTPQAPETTQTPIPSPQDSSSTEEKSNAKPAAPGQFDVDEGSAQRALERTLVQSGALLLQSGQIDLETSLSIIRNQQSVPAFINTDTGLLAASEERRDSTLGAALNLRIGLPFESQLELGLPYQYIDNTSITRVGFEVATQKSTYDDGIGDVSIGIAKTLLKEKGRRPDLIARLSWNADNGDRDQQEGSQGIGSGHNELSGSLTVTKRQDPLIFTGNIRYEYAEEKHNTQPGQGIGLTIGTILAASPETSIRFALNQTFVSETKVNNQNIIGSDQVISSFSLGASSVIDRGNFLNVSVEMGLTEEATDYSLNIAYIKRFSGIFSSK